MDLISTSMEGLMVVATKMLLKYVPFAEDGFILASVVIISLALSNNWFESNETRPTDVWMIPNLSILKEIFPFLTSFTASATFSVTVPDLGFGIRLRGPNILPKRPNFGITLGVAMMTSTSV